MKLISIIVPVYNEKGILERLFNRLESLISNHSQYSWEVICVNDGSHDGSEQTLTAYTQKLSWLKVIHLSRNFGHQNAITAGLELAQGQAIVIIDGDLQDPPELIIDMAKKWEEGFDVVYATRNNRKGETFLKLFTANYFYKLLNKISDTFIPSNTGDFRLMSRPALDALLKLKEHNRFVRGMVSWVGFKQTPIYFDRQERSSGETKYSFKKMFRFAMDGILSFSKVPFKFIWFMGTITLSIGIILGVLTIWVIPLLWLAVSFILGGIQLFCLGIIGEYLSRIYDEVRNRPTYIIKKIDSKQD
ncbi:MAG: glycosyltransferase family 2 protein [Elusimicrobiota bacterium]